MFAQSTTCICDTRIARQHNIHFDAILTQRRAVTTTAKKNWKFHVTNASHYLFRIELMCSLVDIAELRCAVLLRPIENMARVEINIFFFFRSLLRTTDSAWQLTRWQSVVSDFNKYKNHFSSFCRCAASKSFSFAASFVRNANESVFDWCLSVLSASRSLWVRNESQLSWTVPFLGRFNHLVCNAHKLSTCWRHRRSGMGIEWHTHTTK